MNDSTINDANIEQIIRDYLPRIVHLSLATARDNAPWVCEVHFAYDEDLNLYFRSRSSRRHSQEIAANPKVAGNIVVQHALGEPGKGIYFAGSARLLEAEQDVQRAFGCLKQRLGIDDSALQEAQQPDGHKFYQISVETFCVFGGFKSLPSQKYELRWNRGGSGAAA